MEVERENMIQFKIDFPGERKERKYTFKLNFVEDTCEAFVSTDGKLEKRTKADLKPFYEENTKREHIIERIADSIALGNFILNESGNKSILAFPEIRKDPYVFTLEVRFGTPFTFTK